MNDEPAYPKSVPIIDESGSPNAASGVGEVGPSHTGDKRRWVPPVIDTFHPREGLSPDVIREWSGEGPLDRVNQDTRHPELKGGGPVE